MTWSGLCPVMRNFFPLVAVEEEFVLDHNFRIRIGIHLGYSRSKTGAPLNVKPGRRESPADVGPEELLDSSALALAVSELQCGLIRGTGCWRCGLHIFALLRAFPVQK